MLLSSLSKKNLVLSLLLGLMLSSLLLLTLPPKFVEGNRLRYETRKNSVRDDVDEVDGNRIMRTLRDDCENKKDYLFKNYPEKNCEEWAAHPQKSEKRCQKVDTTNNKERKVSFFCPVQCNSDCSTTERRSTTVTIVGAGTSGLAAARSLAAAGIDVIVVEAQSTVGGRVQDSLFGVDDDKYTVENGANWIHGPLNKNGDGAGTGNNHLWEFKQEYDIKGNYQNKTNWKFSDRDGNMVPQATAEKWSKRIDVSLKHCQKRCDDLWALLKKDKTIDDSDEIDISIAQCLREFGYWNGTIKGTTGFESSEEEDVARLLEWQAIDFEYAQQPFEVSNMWAFPLNGNLEPRDWLLTDPRGYNVFLKAWAEQLEEESPNSVVLNQVVETITTTNDHATVVTKEGLTIVSDYVLCTLPLGVLKSGDVAFDPPFSKKRLKGIKGMVMANYAKLYLQFETRFWGEEETILTTGDPEKTNSFPWAINLDLPKYLPGSKILSFHVSDENACAIESQPIDETVAAAVGILQRNYKDAIINVTASKVTNWCENPWSYGSYSDWPPGYTEDQHWEMTHHHGRVWFAGEHTTYDDYGYVHGALDTGLTQADNLIYRVEKIDCKECQKAITITSSCNVGKCKKFATNKLNMKLEKKCEKLCKLMTKKDKSPKEACKLEKMCKKY